MNKAQRKQKIFYDRKSQPGTFKAGERVFLFKPAEKTGDKRKLARPFHGPYRIVKLGENSVKVRRVDKPGDEPILVAQERLRRCPDEIGDGCWPPIKTKKDKRKGKGVPVLRDADCVPTDPTKETAVDSPSITEVISGEPDLKINTDSVTQADCPLVTEEVAVEPQSGSDGALNQAECEWIVRVECGGGQRGVNRQVVGSFA